MSLSLDRSAIKAVLGDWFAEVTGLEPRDRVNAQHWGGTWNPSRTSAPVSAHGILFLKTISTVGVDRLYFEHRSGQPLGAEIIPHVQGARELLWEVQVWSLSQNADQDAHFYLQRVRDLVRGHRARELFRTVGIGIQDIGGALDLSEVQLKRRYSIGQIDITFNAFVDVEDAALGYVETFDVETEWRDAEGSLLPAALQFTGEIP